MAALSDQKPLQNSTDRVYVNLTWWIGLKIKDLFFYFCKTFEVAVHCHQPCFTVFSLDAQQLLSLGHFTHSPVLARANIGTAPAGWVAHQLPREMQGSPVHLDFGKQSFPPTAAPPETTSTYPNQGLNPTPPFIPST